MVHCIDNRPRKVGIAGRRRRFPRRKDGFVYYVASNGKKIYDNEEPSVEPATVGENSCSDSMNVTKTPKKPAINSCEVTLSPCDELKTSMTDASVQTMDLETGSTPNNTSIPIELLQEQQKRIEDLLDQLMKKDMEIENLRRQPTSLVEANVQQLVETEQQLETTVKQLHLIESEFKDFRSYHVKKLQAAISEVTKWKKQANDLALQLENSSLKQPTQTTGGSNIQLPPTVTPEDPPCHAPAIKKHSMVYNGRFLFGNASQGMMDSESCATTPFTHSKKIPMPTPDDRRLRAVIDVSVKKKKPRIEPPCRPASFIASRVVHNHVLTYAGRPMPRLTRRHGDPRVPRCTLVIHSPIRDENED